MVWPDRRLCRRVGPRGVWLLEVLRVGDASRHRCSPDPADGPARRTSQRASQRRGVCPSSSRRSRSSNGVSTIFARCCRSRRTWPTSSGGCRDWRLNPASTFSASRRRSQSRRRSTRPFPFKIRAEGTYHNLGLFFDRLSKFPRIINVGEIVIKPRQPQDATASIEVECVTTTFVLQESKAPATGRGGRGIVPKQPSTK